MFNNVKTVIFCMVLLTGSFFQAAQAESIEYEFAVSTRSIMRAGPNQSLIELVQQLYPGYESIWPKLEQEIKRINPQAFNRYTGKIIPGQRMQLVTIKVIRKSHILHKNVVGSISSIKGYATATDSRGNERLLQDKGDLFEGDRLITEKGATLIIKMVDDAEIHLKQNSSVRLTEYVMKSGFETGSKSIIDLIKGGLRAITGSIGANPLSVYRFQTGVMTIGVRGTDYVVMLCEGNNCLHSSGRNDADSRMHVVVLDGLISLEDEGGVIGELIMGQYAVATSDTKVIVNDAPPVIGLLNEQEQELYNAVQSSPSPTASGKNSIWPWLLGGALLGI